MEKVLRAVNKKIRNVVDKKNPALRGLFQDASLEEGKRLRAKLFFIFSEDASENAVKIAAAIELLHNATLIHDDVLDRSTLRRGRPALYTQWGTPVSLLYGDYLFSKSFSLATEVGNPLIWKEMMDALSETLMGEIEEQYKRGDVSLTKKEYFSIIAKKSGALFGAACKIGLIQRDANERFLEKAYVFGLSIGAAYQILDDANDYFDFDGIGRKYNDVKQGVVTLPLIYVMKQCAPADKNFILKVLKRPKSDWADFEKITNLMRRTGTLLKCCRDARSILIAAKDDFIAETAGQCGRCLDVAMYIEEKINDVEKKYSDRGGRVRRD